MDQLGTTNESIRSRVRQNIDPTLSHADVEDRKRIVDAKVASDRDAFKTRVESEETKELRKRREEFQKMRAKFNL
jgi:hypothetical protein